MYVTTTQAKAAAVARFGLRRHFVGSPANELLAMLGHAGHEEGFAEHVLVEMARTGCSVSEAIERRQASYEEELVAVAVRHGAGY